MTAKGNIVFDSLLKQYGNSDTLFWIQDSFLSVTVTVNFFTPKTYKLLKSHVRTPEGTLLFQYLPEKKSKQKELERKSKQ